MSVRHALLALLSDGPKYGMQLRDEYESSTGDVWPLNVGQVYTTLQRLERDGCVAADDQSEADRQKPFRITDRGRSELVEWLKTPPGPTAPPRDDLVTKVLVAQRVPGVDVHEVIQAHRRQIVELMQQWTRFKDVQTEADVAFALVVEAQLIRLGSVVHWLDFAEAHVEDPADGSVNAAGPKLRRRVVVRQ
jgi:DNA-binding PadR family transcriptional regulator